MLTSLGHDATRHGHHFLARGGGIGVRGLGVRGLGVRGLGLVLDPDGMDPCLSRVVRAWRGRSDQRVICMMVNNFRLVKDDCVHTL